MTKILYLHQYFNTYEMNGSTRSLEISKALIKNGYEVEMITATRSNQKEFPSNYELNGWFISLKKNGEVTSHIHEGWLSGVFYLKKPTNKKKRIKQRFRIFSKLPKSSYF